MSDEEFEREQLDKANYELYRREHAEAQEYYDSRIADTESKAFEYGVLVVRSAILVSGGGLLAIPTIAGLSSAGKVDLSSAAFAGLMFAVSLMIAVVGAYLVHINWMLHAEAWRAHWGDRSKFLRDYYLEGKTPSISDREEHFSRSINLTFYLPHVLAMLYLVIVGLAFWKLYLAFGVGGGQSV